MRHTRDDGLMAEVHQYRNLIDEQAQKQAEVDHLNDRLCHDSTIFISFLYAYLFFFFYITGSRDFSCHKTSHDLIT